MKLTRLFLLLITIYFSHPAFSSSYFSFRKYQVEDGLSHNTVWCAVQDKYGFIWFGTSDGLNRYDGKENKIYRNVQDDKYSLENNCVEALLEDGENIWVGTNSGLYVYNRAKDNFSYFKKTTKYGVFISSEIKRLVKAVDGKIWIATLGQGFFIYDKQKKELVQNSIQTSFVWDICQGDDKLMYVSSLQDGLLCFNGNGKLMKAYKNDVPASSFNSLKINCVQNIDGEIWVGASNNLLCRVNKQSGILESHDAGTFNFGIVHAILKYKDNELLLGTDNGLYLFNRVSRKFRRGDDPSDIHSLSDEAVNSMLWDAEGALWVLTNLGGANYMSKQTKRFNYNSPSYLSNNSGTVKLVGPLCENKYGGVWVGTRNGLRLFDTSNERFINDHIIFNNKLAYDIRSLMQDGDYLWVGTYTEGLKVINVRTGSMKCYSHSRGIPNTICSNDVLCIYKDRKGEVFIGTSWGLCRYNPSHDNFITVTSIGSMVSVVDIHEDMYNNLWIATSNSGVFRYNIPNGHWKHFQHVRSDNTTITANSVITIFEDIKGVMWFGTNGGGLCSFNQKDDTFLNFDPHNTLLPSKVIYSMEQDMLGNLWISCNAGLIRINPLIKDSFRQFTIDDGLQGNQFMVHSSLKSKNGKLYFGGINGLNSFIPEQFTDNAYIPPVYITDIKFPNQVGEDAAKQILQLDTPIYMTDRITIPYKNNSFSLRFMALSYVNPSKNHYSYRLKGVDKEWVENTVNNIASYTNLAPGEYVFEVRGSNNDNKWNEKTTKLLIVITPPWWRTNLAYFFYLVLFLGTAYYAAWRWNLYVKLKYKRKMEDYQVTKETEVYKSKINFFINLVHEIRTPLSLIKLPLEKLQEKEWEGKESKYISVMDENVNYLLNVTNQLLDFQKMESRELQLAAKRYNVNQLVRHVYNQFAGLAELKGINLTLRLPDKEIIAVLDSEKVTKMLVNLMGNALKYSNEFIELSLFEIDNYFEILVKDDGPGIPEEKKEKVFEAFYQLPDDKVASGGTGIGLAFAKSLAEAHHGTLRVEDGINGGSTFVLSLPMKQEMIETEEKPVEISVVMEDKNSEVFDYTQKNFTVLVVEDNRELLNLICESLSVWFRVLKADNGHIALDLLSKDSVDIVVSDIMMPEMNGLELCAKIKSDIDYSHIPVILLTAKTTLESKVEGMECGADVYVEKPFSIKQLRMQIENILKLRVAFHKLMISFSDTSFSTISEFALSKKDNEFIKKVQEVAIEQLSDENFSIDALAEQMCMSRSNFYRKIKALSGLAPNDYLKTLRLNRAAELIRNGVRISEVSAQVGFTSSSYFAKCFKAQFNVLPKDYQG